MSASLAADVRSTRPLSEVARHLVIPAGIVDTLWFEVEAQLREWGIEFDVWQDGLGQLILGLRSDGLFAASVGGVGISIPRQVAKTFVVSRILFALCALYPGMLVLWSAHRLDTASLTFRRLKGLAQSPAVRKLLAGDRSGGIREANGEWEFKFANGSSIMFGSRAQGWGLGFDRVDVEVFDEAQILDDGTLDDMIAATNQSQFPHGALLLFMGTPPRPWRPERGRIFTARRVEAIGKDPEPHVHATRGDALWVECSADADVGRPGGPSLDDRDQVLIANPSVPHRTPWVSVERLRRNLVSDDSWRREGLGVWDLFYAEQSLVSVDEWSGLAVDGPPSGGVKSFGVKFSADGNSVAVVGALNPGDGEPIHVELVGEHTGSMALGSRQLVAWLKARWRECASIVVDGPSHSGAFVQELLDAGVSKRVLKAPSWPDVATANAMFLEAVRASEVSHLGIEGQWSFDDSVTGTTKKLHGTKGAWSWDPITVEGDALPVGAASLAIWGAKTSTRVPGRKQKASF